VIEVRPAAEADIAAMSVVMTASVTELCAADHHDDAHNIAKWVSNRTPEGVAGMLANPDQSFFVAEYGGEVAAVGAVNRQGVVIFTYVSPAHRFQGLSRALLARLEQVLHDWGNEEGRLVSTATARRFYLDRGWVEDGPPLIEGFSTSYPMRKRLQPQLRRP
jgi:GNAT superfamily N-acetyltransferase